MIMSCPKHTTTRAIHLLRFEFISSSKHPNRLKDDHYNRIILILIAWIIRKGGKVKNQ